MLPSKAFGAAAIAIAFGNEDQGVFLVTIILVFVVFVVFHGLGIGIWAIVRMAVFTDATIAAFAVVDVSDRGRARRGIFLPGLAWTGLDGGDGRGS